MIGPHALPASLGDRFQISEAHPPRILEGTARRLPNRNRFMRDVEESRLARAVLESVGNAGLDRLDRPSERESSEDVAFVDRRLPRPALRRKEASLSSELEAPSDLWLDPRP